MKPIMSEVIERLHQLERQPDVVTATVAMGFPFADIRDAGAAVLVTTADDEACTMGTWEGTHVKSEWPRSSQTGQRHP